MPFSLIAPPLQALLPRDRCPSSLSSGIWRPSSLSSGPGSLLLPPSSPSVRQSWCAGCGATARSWLPHSSLRHSSGSSLLVLPTVLAGPDSLLLVTFAIPSSLLPATLVGPGSLLLATLAMLGRRDLGLLLPGGSKIWSRRCLPRSSGGLLDSTLRAAAACAALLGRRATDASDKACFPGPLVLPVAAPQIQPWAAPSNGSRPDHDSERLDVAGACGPGFSEQL